jgi:alkylation response protein AidB-like acyl-CoA dehydrogenase
MTAIEEITVEQFSDEARAFLDAHATPKSAERRFVWGEGDDDVATFEEVDPVEEAKQLAKAKEWRATRYDAGFGWVAGPPELGGRGLPASYARAYEGIEADYETPPASFFGIGLGMVAPTILAHATDAVQRAYLPGMYRGDIVGCQLFSEPGAGSDLAGLQTKAERDGDEWVVTGQKVWTSGAQYSDIGEIICRTDPSQPKHRGLTGFVVDMHAPGVEVRPLRQMTGGASFNEVFFTEVRVPDDHRLGDVNGGWTVALTTLMNERASIGAGGGGLAAFASAHRLTEMLRYLGRDQDRVLRDELMKLHISLEVARFSNQRAIAKIRAGQLPGPELSTAKLALTQNMTAVAEFVARALGPRLTADTGEWGTFAWTQFVLGMPGLRIAGGSDEVMRNIVGERVLGLPKEPGDNAKQPFADTLKN